MSHNDADRVSAVLDPINSLSARERFDVLQFAWLVTAIIARDEALDVPGGFPGERPTDRHTAQDG